MTHTLIARIMTASPVSGLGMDIIDSKAITSVSQISAEDTARRFFRKNSIPMTAVEKRIENEIHFWTSYALNHVVTHVITEPLMAEVIEDKLTQDAANDKAVKIFNGVDQLMTNLYERWQDEKNNEDFAEYTDAIAKKIEALGGTYELLTSRPFALIYKVGEFKYKIGRNRSGGFGFWTVQE